MPHRFYRLAERLAQMSFIIMVCWDIFSQTLKLGYTYMTNWCGATVVLHTDTLTGAVWATVSVCLWVSLGGEQSRCAQQVIELGSMRCVFQPPMIWCLLEFYSSVSDGSSWVTLTERLIVCMYAWCLCVSGSVCRVETLGLGIHADVVGPIQPTQTVFQIK